MVDDLNLQQVVEMLIGIVKASQAFEEEQFSALLDSHCL